MLLDLRGWSPATMIPAYVLSFLPALCSCWNRFLILATSSVQCCYMPWRGLSFSECQNFPSLPLGFHNWLLRYSLNNLSLGTIFLISSSIFVVHSDCTVTITKTQPWSCSSMYSRRLLYLGWNILRIIRNLVVLYRWCLSHLLTKLLYHQGILWLPVCTLSVCHTNLVLSNQLQYPQVLVLSLISALFPM